MCITKQDREDREIIGGRSCHQWQGCTQMFTLLLMVTKNLPWLVAKAVDCISCCHGDASILITNTVCTVVCEREGHWERGRWGRVKEKDKEEMSVCSFEQTWGFQRINQRVKHSICGAWECVRCCITFCVWDEACISALSYTHSLTHTHTHFLLPLHHTPTTSLFSLSLCRYNQRGLADHMQSLNITTN